MTPNRTRRRARRLLAVTGLLLAGWFVSAWRWETLDDRTLWRVHGAPADVQGWARDWLSGLSHECGARALVAPDTPTAAAVRQAVAEHSPPDSANPRWHQAHRMDNWLLAELSFERLSPAVVLLQRQGAGWRLHPTAIWSGSTAPWRPGPRIRDHLRQQAPDAPAALLACFQPVQDFKTLLPASG